MTSAVFVGLILIFLGEGIFTLFFTVIDDTDVCLQN